MHPIERLVVPPDVAIKMLGPRSKEAKRLRRYLRAERIAESRWQPGLHTRWEMEGKKRLGA